MRRRRQNSRNKEAGGRMDRYIGRRLEGRYEILELIGVGGMANVYKGRDTIENRTVAIKLLREEFLNNEEFLRRFKTESKAMTVLSHPNIVKVYDVSFSDKINSIVMELIEGITLKEYIEQQGVLTWKETLYFTVQILRALQHAHDRGIVHRDIKPHNVMLLPDGTIKVTDFGIARFARSEIKTLTDRAIGSVHYISPEQARGSHTDARTDIYSVGVMLFEMLTGRLPFEADSPVSVAIKQIQTQPLQPRSINPQIPAGLEDITMRAMRKDINRRYQSAAEMLRCLDEFKRDPSLRFDSGAGKKGRQGTDFDDEDPPEKRTPVVAILSGITFAFVLASMVFIFFMVRMNNPFATVEDVVVPTLTDLKYETVQKSNRYSDFTIRLESNDFNDDYPKGVIFEQDPKPNRKVKVGSVIKVKVSSGPRQVLIQEYSGQDAMSVIAKLTELGLEVTERQEFNATVPEGSVIRTDPPRNTQVASGSAITVYISLGAENKYVDVPDILGFNIEDARAILQGYQLKIGTITTSPDSDMPGGTVLAQDPPSTSKLEQGSGVNVVVSEGDITVPRLVAQVLLPDTDELTELQAVLDGNVVHTDSKIPSEVRIWRITLEGSGISQLKVYVGGKLYQEFEVDFYSKTYSMTVDNSDSF